MTGLGSALGSFGKYWEASYRTSYPSVAGYVARVGRVDADVFVVLRSFEARSAIYRALSRCIGRALTLVNIPRVDPPCLTY